MLTKTSAGEPTAITNGLF